MSKNAQQRHYDSYGDLISLDHVFISEVGLSSQQVIQESVGALEGVV